jgi:hypothetical protein
MRLTIIPLVLCCLAVRGSLAQSPADGKVQGSAYVSSYFGLSYTWPTILTPFDTTALHLPPSPHGNEFLLFSARQADEPYGVVIVAEKLNVPTAHGSGIKDASDFISRVKRSFDPESKPKILNEIHFKNADGLAFDEMDYVSSGEYSSAIVLQLEKFLIVFKCNAKSSVELSEMTKSALATRRQGPGEKQ